MGGLCLETPPALPRETGGFVHFRAAERERAASRGFRAVSCALGWMVLQCVRGHHRLYENTVIYHGHASRLCRTALPQQLQLPDRRVLAGGTGGSRGRAALCRDRHHGRMLAVGRRACVRAGHRMQAAVDRRCRDAAGAERGRNADAAGVAGDLAPGLRQSFPVDHGGAPSRAEGTVRGAHVRPGGLDSHAAAHHRIAGLFGAAAADRGAGADRAPGVRASLRHGRREPAGRRGRSRIRRRAVGTRSGGRRHGWWRRDGSRRTVEPRRHRGGPGACGGLDRIERARTRSTAGARGPRGPRCAGRG